MLEYISIQFQILSHLYLTLNLIQSQMNLPKSSAGMSLNLSCSVSIFTKSPAIINS